MVCMAEDTAKKRVRLMKLLTQKTTTVGANYKMKTMYEDMHFILSSSGKQKQQSEMRWFPPWGCRAERHI